MENTHNLKRKDLINIIEQCTELVELKTYSGFCESMLNMKYLFDFNFVHVGSVSFVDEWKVQTFYTNLSIMNDWSLYSFPASSGQADPVFNMVSAGKTLLWWEELPSAINGALLYPHDTCMGGYSCSVQSPDKSSSAVISFGGKEFQKSERTEDILEIMRPHIAATYFRLKEMKEATPELLSKREINVLRWLKAGKTSWEISKILNISENTVNFHIKNIKRKLNASNRQHAVAIAIANAIIS